MPVYQLSEIVTRKKNLTAYTCPRECWLGDRFKNTKSSYLIHCNRVKSPDFYFINVFSKFVILVADGETTENVSDSKQIPDERHNICDCLLSKKPFVCT